MKRGKGLSRYTSLRRVALVTATRKRPRARTGFDRKTVAAIKDRDGGCVVQMRCQGTRDPRELVANHITNRGAGGTSDPTIDAVTNGIAVCWLCNSWLEDFPLIAYRYGWKRRHGLPPGPVLYPDGEWYDLLPGGQRRRTEAPEAAPERYSGGAA